MGKLGKLDRMLLKGYKSIKELDLEFGNINILLGANGAGKSNFIGFFNFMRKIIQKELELTVAQMGGANKVLHFGSKVTNELVFDLHFSPNRYNATLIPTNNDKLIFKEENTYIDSSNKNFIKPNIGGFESNLPLYDPKDWGVNAYVVKYINDWKVYHFHDTSKASPMKQPCRVDDYYSFAVDGHNLPAYLYYIKQYHNKSYQMIVKTIQRVAPFFHDFILEPDIANEDMIKLRWKHKGSDLYFDANDLSDGTIRFICLTTLLMQPNLPTMILIDEPELGLHPYALNILASLFKVAAKKTQIIASTQSTTFVDFFDAKDIIVVDREDNSSSFKRLDLDELKEWIDEYSIGELWQKNLLGANP